MKNKLKKLRTLISQFENIVEQYPESEAYKEILCKLQQDYVNIVSKIGTKKK